MFGALRETFGSLSFDHLLPGSSTSSVSNGLPIIDLNAGQHILHKYQQVRIEVDTLEHKNQTLAAVCSRTLEQFERTVNTGAYALANVDENLQYLPKAIEELEAKLASTEHLLKSVHDLLSDFEQYVCGAEEMRRTSIEKQKMANRHRNDHLTKQMILEAAFKQELAEYKSTGVMPRMKTTTAETVNAFEAEDIPDAPEATENLELFLNDDSTAPTTKSISEQPSNDE